MTARSRRRPAAESRTQPERTPKTSAKPYPAHAQAGARIAVVAAVALHLFIVWSIASQPLNVNGHPPAERSVIWPFHNDTVHRIGPAADLFAVYHAGHAIAVGISPYTLREQPRRTPYFYPFRYLPVVGQTLGALLIQVRPRMAYWMWLIVMEILLAWYLVVLVGRSPPSIERAVVVCALLLSSPYFLEAHMGQFTFAVMALVSVAVLLVEHPPSWRWRYATWLAPALALAAAVTVKVQPVVAAAAMVRHRRYWPVLGTAGLFTVLVAAPYFLTHAGEWARFRAANTAVLAGGLDSGNYGFAYLVYNGARDIGLRAVTDHWPAVVTAGYTLILVLSAIVVLLSRLSRPAVGVAAMIATHYIGYGHVWEHHYSALIVVAALAWQALANASSHHARWVLVALVLLALPTPFVFLDGSKDPSVFDPSQDWPAAARYLLILSKAGPGVLLYGLCLAALSREGLRWPRSRAVPS